MGQRYVPPAWTGDAIHLIRRLALERFLELGIGTKEEFDEIWADAFCLNGEEEKSPARKKGFYITRPEHRT